mgnify:FL=1
MAQFLNLVSSLCGTFVNWFDNTIRGFANLATDLANVAIRVLLALGLYKAIFEGLLTDILSAF